MLSRKWLIGSVNCLPYSGSFRPKEESKTPWGPLQSMMPMQLIRMDLEARFFFFFDKISFQAAAVDSMKDYTFVRRLHSLKMGQSSNHDFLGHLFNLAVYGLKSVFLSIVFVCFLIFFIISLFMLWCLLFPCEVTLQNGRVHVCFYISDGFI